MKHIPNILSSLRIAMIPLFVWQMAVGNVLSAAVILALSGLTDLLDGFLARHFGWVSQLGKVLDPVADKLTQVTVCITLLVKMRTLWPFFLVLLIKDAVMLVLGGYLVGKGVKLDGAQWFGKLATVLFYVTMTALLIAPGMPALLAFLLLMATVIAALTAALMYIPQFTRYLQSARQGKSGIEPLSSDEAHNPA